MGVVIRHLALCLSLCALGAGTWRLASAFAPWGLERVVSWMVWLASAIVVEELGLGLLGLGGSTVALAGAAAVSWLAAWRILPAGDVPAGAEAAAWWSARSAIERAALGALAGGFAALAAILLHRPESGFDGLTYHLPEVVGFVQSGHPGEILTSAYGLPVGNYPLTNEVLLAWVTGLSHGFAAQALWSPVAGGLAIAAGWLGLRDLGVGRWVRVLALMALMASPLVVMALAQPGTDLPALTWLVSCAALCAGSRRRPRLLSPALVALALGIGTKTTVVELGIIVIALASWPWRHHLRTNLWRATCSVVAAVVVGGVWPLRNLLQHGSPLWPFAAAPWGDPVPPGIQLFSHTLLQRFRVTLLDHAQAYVSAISGAVLLLGGPIVLAPLIRTRRTLAAAGAVLLGLLTYVNSPVTGLGDAPQLGAAAGSSIRYLMPVFAAGALALALLATDARSPRGRLAAVAALVGAVGWSVVRDVQQGFGLPLDWWLGPGVAAGMVVAVSGTSAALRLGRRTRWPRYALATLATLSATALLALGSTGYLGRHALVGSEIDATVAGFLSRAPGFDRDQLPVATAPFSLALPAGDRLQHPTALIGEHEGCASVRSRARTGWVVIRVVHPEPVPGHPGVLFPPSGTAQGCLAQRRPSFAASGYLIYGPAYPPGR